MPLCITFLSVVITESVVCIVMVYADSKHYSNKIRPDSDLVLPAIGELVVVRTTANERWYRAAVLGRDLDHNIKVSCASILFISFRFSSLTTVKISVLQPLEEV